MGQIVIRPFEERLSTNVYSGAEIQMLQKEMNVIQAQLEPTWHWVLYSQTIRNTDILLHGAPN